eukprot:787522-Prymnesium_polylepis.1
MDAADCRIEALPVSHTLSVSSSRVTCQDTTRTLRQCHSSRLLPFRSSNLEASQSCCHASLGRQAVRGTLLAPQRHARLGPLLTEARDKVAARDPSAACLGNVRHDGIALYAPGAQRAKN